MAKKRIIVGARGSLLSAAQAKIVIKILKKEFPAHSFSLKKIVTFGDRHKNWQRDDIGIFVKEIEQALLAGEIDIAIHSLKDVPTQIPDELKLAGVPKREDPRDCIISKDKIPLAKLKKGAVIGTSSLRRRAQLLHWRSDLRIRPLRGNLDTRMRKLIAGEFDAIVVALAGVVRLGVDEKLFVQPISPHRLLPAPGQGALALEIRAEDKLMEALTQRINDQKSFLCTLCERAFLQELGGGCRLPIGALAEIKNGQIYLQVMVSDRDGKKIIRISQRAMVRLPIAAAISQKAPLKQAESLGRRLAQRVLQKGAREMLSDSRSGS